MKRLALITNLKIDNSYSHHFVDCDGNKIQIKHSNKFNICSQDFVERNGLYLIEVSNSDSADGDYIGIIKDLIEADSQNGILYIIENFDSFNLKEKSAIIRLCKGFYASFIDYRIDIEKALLSTQEYFKVFNIAELPNRVGVKVSKYVNVKIGDCDTFSASLYPSISGFLLYPHAPDKYIEELKRPFSYSKEYVDDQFCSGYEMKRHFEVHYEKEWQDYVNSIIELYRYEVMGRYKRNMHFRTVYEQFLEKERQEVSTAFYQETDDIYKYIKEKFPNHYNQYHRKTDYIF